MKRILVIGLLVLLIVSSLGCIGNNDTELNSVSVLLVNIDSIAEVRQQVENSQEKSVLFVIKYDDKNVLCMMYEEDKKDPILVYGYFDEVKINKKDKEYKIMRNFIFNTKRIVAMDEAKEIFIILRNLGATEDIETYAESGKDFCCIYDKFYRGDLDDYYKEFIGYLPLKYQKVEKEIKPPKTKEKPKEIKVEFLCLNQAIEKLDELYDGQAEGYITVQGSDYYYIHYAHDKRRIVSPYYRDAMCYWNERVPTLEIEGCLKVPKTTEEITWILKSLKNSADEGEYKYVESDPIIEYNFTFFDAEICKNIFEGKDKKYDPSINAKINELREAELSDTYTDDKWREKLLEYGRATKVEDYVTWVKGYIEKYGIEDIYWYDFPWKWHFRSVYINKDCEIPYIHRQSWAEIIVDKNVEVVLPSILGNQTIFYMKDFSTTSNSYVAVYNDIEFKEGLGDIYDQVVEKRKKLDQEWDQRDAWLEATRSKRYKEKECLIKCYFREATLNDYKSWLQGNLAKVDKLSPREYICYEYGLGDGWYVALYDCTIPPLYGASKIYIIVPKGVNVTYPNGLGHIMVFFMEGFRSEGILHIPIYDNIYFED